jgi:hypothetical protein
MHDIVQKLWGFPIAIFRNLRPTLIRHFQEQQVGELLNVIAIIHAVMPQRVAEPPEFLNDVGHGKFRG